VHPREVVVDVGRVFEAHRQAHEAVRMFKRRPNGSGWYF
jgi:hypothetical protein